MWFVLLCVCLDRSQLKKPSFATRSARRNSLTQAAKLWRQANELAVLKDNVDWTAHRAHVCEARLRLAAKAARVKNGGAAFGF